MGPGDKDLMHYPYPIPQQPAEIAEVSKTRKSGEFGDIAVVKEQRSGSVDKLLLLVQVFQQICPVSLAFITREVS